MQKESVNSGFYFERIHGADTAEKGTGLKNLQEKDYRVFLYISAQLHNYIMYHPIFRNWKQYVKSFRFELGTTVNDERIAITDGIEDKPGFCQQSLEHLFTIKPIQKDEVSTEPENIEDEKEEAPTVEKSSEDSKAKSVFGRIFNYFLKK